MNRYIQLSNFCSGLCMPEIAYMAVKEGLDNLVNDALYGTLYRNINMKRTLIDQHFSRMLLGFAKITINTGEDNYLRTMDAIEGARVVLASNFINLQLARLALIKEEHIALGNAFEIDPALKNGFLFELSHVLLAREIFSNMPMKYMPPTKHMDGNLFRTHATDMLFNLISVLTGQGIETVGSITEGIFTPLIHDRTLSIEGASYVFNAARDLGAEIDIKPDVIIARRAQTVLQETRHLLGHILEVGLTGALAEGIFGGVKRNSEEGRGKDGVFSKSGSYFNPFESLIQQGEQANG